MHEPVSIQPEAVYDDGALYLSLGLTAAALAKARRGGELRFTRQGKRTLYLGQWVLDWLQATATTEPRRLVKQARQRGFKLTTAADLAKHETGVSDA